MAFPQSEGLKATDRRLNAQSTTVSGQSRTASPPRSDLQICALFVPFNVIASPKPH